MDFPPFGDGPEDADPTLVTLLKEWMICYKTFLNAFGEQHKRNKQTDDEVGYWLLYLTLLGYDVGFASLSILADGLDRQLLIMKRQAFEFNTKAQFLIKNPDKALKQFQSLAPKMREFVERVTPDSARDGQDLYLEEYQRQLDALPPEVGPSYGHVDTFQMLKTIDPDGHRQRYGMHHWFPSQIVHGNQLGMWDALARLPDGRLWMSHRSLMSSVNGNVAVIAQSLADLLIATGTHFRLHNVRWQSLITRYNQHPLIADGHEKLEASAKEAPQIVDVQADQREYVVTIDDNEVAVSKTAQLDSWPKNVADKAHLMRELAVGEQLIVGAAPRIVVKRIG